MLEICLITVETAAKAVSLSLSQMNPTWCKYFEATTRGVPLKKVFLKISQNSQENTCARASFLIKLQAEITIARVYFLIKLQAWGLQLY